jgi:DMSO/TMAO reductase YedYZ molybdopterin-dependent catalytic subunit
LNFRKISLLIAGLLLVTAIAFTVEGLFEKEQDYVEVRDYQGTRLDSVNQFRENSIKGPQDVNISEYRLSITGLVTNPVEYSYKEVLGGFRSYKKVVELFCVEGWSAEVLWEGVRIEDLLKDKGIKPNATIIIFHAADGYTTSLSFDYVLDNNILLAYKINGLVLPKRNGFPFQLVAESKWGYKWCRWVTEIELSADENYQGFWERRGYSDSADLDEHFWGG